jgi:hypothetical protein
MKYLTFNLPPVRSGAGLGHHLGNLYAFLNFAYHNDSHLVAPIFLLHGKHNSSKFLRSDLSKYFQFDSVVVGGKNFPIIPHANSLDPENIKTIEVDQKTYDSCGGALPISDFFSSLPDCSRFIPTNNSSKEVAKNVARMISDKYTCIHVRRGDKVFDLKTGEVRDGELHHATSPENILRFAKLCGNKKVYIMTDESPSFFSSLLDSEFDFFFYKDFDILNIKDNFLLYQIENEIMRLADKKVSTFSVGYSVFYEAHKDFYDFYLLNRKGHT